MTHDPENTDRPIASVQARHEGFTLPRRWQCFLLTIAGLIAFIILVASFRAVVS